MNERVQTIQIELPEDVRSALEDLRERLGRIEEAQTADGHGRLAYDARELCAELGISRASMNRLMDREGLPYHKLGRKLVFLRAEVERWLRNR